MRRNLGISYIRDNNGSERIRYTPGSLGNSTPGHTYQTVRWQSVQKHLNAIRRKIQQIAHCACFNHDRGELEVESDVERLARNILPSGGFVSFLAPGEDLVFDPDEWVSSLPWEMFEEHYLQCSENPEHVELTDSHEKLFCRRDGSEMIRMNDKLGISRQVSFHVRPVERQIVCPKPNFLLIIDPLGDLCSKDNDPSGICAKKTNDLIAFLDQYFELIILRGHAASSEAVLGQIGRDDLAGIYYLGHGDVASQGEGRLILADSPLFSHEIIDVRPTAPVIFLNACWSMGQGGEWNHDKKNSPVGYAFAVGSEKAVIGSLYPLVNVQASCNALDYFENLIAKKMTSAESLRKIRRASFAKYMQKKPDVSWMSYRLFGKSDEKLINFIPNQDLEIREGEFNHPLFDSDGIVEPSLFAFNIDDLLLRAVKRRNFQNRIHISLEDFVAGMLRVGNLTRFLCWKTGVNPDGLYKNIGEKDVGPNDTFFVSEKNSEKEDIDDGTLFDVDKWLAKGQDFEQELLDFLSTAYEKTVNNNETLISEKCLLENLFLNDGNCVWNPRVTPFFPHSEMVRDLLDEDIGRVVDDNGCVILPPMNKAAKKIIETVHVLAQQRGTIPVPNRLLLAAFLTEPTGFVVKECLNQGIPVEEFRTLMISSTEAKGETKFSFALSYEACSRIILPMLQLSEKMRVSSGKKEINEEIMFKAFVSIAPEAFKRFLLQLSCPLDLNEILPDSLKENALPGDNATANIHSSEIPQRDMRQGFVAGDDVSVVKRESFEDNAWESVLDAVRLAKEMDCEQIRSPHLFAVLLSQPEASINSLLAELNVSPEDLREIVLSVIPEKVLKDNSDSSTVELSVNTHEILKEAVNSALSDGRIKATQEDIIRIFLSSKGGIVNAILSQIAKQNLENPDNSGSIHTGLKKEEKPALIDKLKKDLQEKLQDGHFVDLNETVEILTELKPSLEENHHVVISTGALLSAVKLSLPNKDDGQWPFKALEVLDKACLLAEIIIDRQGTGLPEVTYEHVNKAIHGNDSNKN